MFPLIITRFIDEYALKATPSGKKCQTWITVRTEQNFSPLSFDWVGKKLQFGSLLILKFSLPSDSICINDSKYPQANDEVENSDMIGIRG